MNSAEHENHAIVECCCIWKIVVNKREFSFFSKNSTSGNKKWLKLGVIWELCPTIFVKKISCLKTCRISWDGWYHNMAFFFKSVTTKNLIWEAKIFPILKRSFDPYQCDNYRPISLLSTFGNLFESFILTKIKRIMEKRNILRDSHFGFMVVCPRPMP